MFHSRPKQLHLTEKTLDYIFIKETESEPDSIESHITMWRPLQVHATPDHTAAICEHIQ